MNEYRNRDIYATCPFLGITNPEISFIKLDFPEPFTPIIETNSPSFISNEILFIALFVL